MKNMRINGMKIDSSIINQQVLYIHGSRRNDFQREFPKCFSVNILRKNNKLDPKNYPIFIFWRFLFHDF